MKALFTIVLVLVLFTSLSASSFTLMTAQEVTGGGIGLGSILAIVLSWSRNSSILWAILHAIFGWIYVIYFVFTR